MARAVFEYLGERSNSPFARDAGHRGTADAPSGAAQSQTRELVADESAATSGENRRTVVKHARYYWLTCPNETRNVTSYCIAVGIHEAYIAASIANLGSKYVVGINAVRCATGDTLASEQVEASNKEHLSADR